MKQNKIKLTILGFTGNSGGARLSRRSRLFPSLDDGGKRCAAFIPSEGTDGRSPNFEFRQFGNLERERERGLLETGVCASLLLDVRELFLLLFVQLFCFNWLLS